MFDVKDLKGGISVFTHIAWAILHGGKNIENRSRKIQPGWYALHTTSRKTTPPLIDYVSNIVEIPKDFNHNKWKQRIVGFIHIRDNDRQYQINPWVYPGCGNVHHFIDEVIVLKNFIKTPGAQNVPWSFSAIDNHNKRYDKYTEDLIVIISKNYEKQLESENIKLFSKLKI